MDNAVALFSGSPISTLNLVKPTRKRKTYKRAKTFPEMSHDTAPYKVFGSFGDVECKKRRIQQVDNKTITDSGFIQYLTGEDESLGQMLSKHPDDLWLSGSNQVPSKNRDMTNGNTNQNDFFQVRAESANALPSQMVNCPNVPSQQNEPSVANTEKTYQATRNLNDTSDCNQILTITNEVANLDSFNLILNDIVSSASKFEPANLELLKQTQGISVPMTMSQGLAPVLPPLKSSSPQPTTMLKAQPTYAMLIGNYMPKNMPKELTSHASSKWNSVPLTTSKSGQREGKTLNQRNSSPLSTNSVEAATLTSRNSMSMTSSQLSSGSQSQQISSSMQWTSNHASLVQPSHSVQLEQQKNHPLSSAQFSPSRDSIIKSFNGQPKQMQEDIIRILKKRMSRESKGLMAPDAGITFQEMFTQATNSVMDGACTPGESTYTSAATDKSTSTFHYTSSQQNYPEAQPTYIAEKSINTQSSSIPSAYSHHSNSQHSNTQASFRQTTNTQPSNSQHGYNQTTNLQPTFNQITKKQPSNYNLAQTIPSNTQASNVVSSLRQTVNTNLQSANNQTANLQYNTYKQTNNTEPTNPHSANNPTANLKPSFIQTANTQLTNPHSANNQKANLQSTIRQTNNTHFARYQSAPTPSLNTNLPDIQTSFRQTASSKTHHPQSGYSQAPNAQPSFIDTTNKQPSHPQLAYTQSSNTQQTNLQTTFRQTTNTHIANPQQSYFPDSSTINQSASFPPQEPMDFLLTPPLYTSTSNYFTTKTSDSLSEQFKTQNFENSLFSDLNTPTMESYTPEFTSLTKMESIPSSPKAEDDDLLSSNNDSFYLSSIPSICFA